MFEIARALREVALDAPVADHQMVFENALGSGVDIVTSRGIQAV
jgi:CxxC motif-containing protein